MKPLFKAICAGWVFLAATVAGAATAAAGSAYELAVITPVPGAGPAIYRIDVASGQVSAIVGSNFTITKDTQALPPGSYHLQWIASLDAKSYWLYRFDEQTGRTWFYSGGVWTEYLPAK